MKWRLDKRDMLTGCLVYTLGDTVAALILGQGSLLRTLGMMGIGATVYALEIPNWFRWIDRRTPDAMPPGRRAWRRTVFALLYFNPLWIARHLLFIRVLTLGWPGVSWDLLRLGAMSFLFNIPLSALGNYVIQVRIPLRGRFLASAAFSGLLAIYYALSEALF